jgi:hypothetical protein
MKTLNLLSIICVLALSHTVAAKARPNIIYFMTDDQTISTLGCYGNKDMITPNIDLRRRGQQVRSAPHHAQEHAALQSVAPPAALYLLATLIRVTFP